MDVAEDGETAFLSGEEILEADNAEGMDAGEVPETETAPQPEEVPPAQATSDYYTEADGILCISTEYKNTVHNGYYLFDENGYLVTGQKEVKSGNLGQTEDTEFWFRDIANAVVYPEFEGEEISPYSSSLGQQIRDDWGMDRKYFPSL